MNDQPPRRGAGFNSRTFRQTDRIGARPDRIAFWAVVLAVAVLVIAAASAHAGGGVGTGGGKSGCPNEKFGSRTLSKGDCGGDVRTLNWILRSREFGVGAGLGDQFDRRTESAVHGLQQVAGLRRTGVVDEATRDAVVSTMRKDEASYYGKGLFGNGVACGGTLTRTTIGVAHKTLPCGTKVTFKYKGQFLRTRVIDRGPYIKGRKWDLTQAAAERLGLIGVGVDTVRAAIVR